MVHNVNSMETKLTQTIFHFVVVLVDHMNLGLFNTTKASNSGFQNFK